MNRTLLYTANADSINAFYGDDAAQKLQAIYNADDRLTGRREIRNGDPDNELDGELFVVVDEDGDKDNDLRNAVSDALIERVTAGAARVEYVAECMIGENGESIARVGWGANPGANRVSVLLMDDGGLESSGILDWSAITDDDGEAFSTWLTTAEDGDTFRWHAPAGQ